QVPARAAAARRLSRARPRRVDRPRRHGVARPRDRAARRPVDEGAGALPPGNAAGLAGRRGGRRQVPGGPADRPGRSVAVRGGRHRALRHAGRVGPRPPGGGVVSALSRARGHLVRTPLLVLLTGAVLPGVGHVVIGRPFRGLMFVFYILLLGIITVHVADPDRSFLGRYAGGV